MWIAELVGALFASRVRQPGARIADSTMYWTYWMPVRP